MHAELSGVRDTASRTIHFYGPAKCHPSGPISSHPGRFTRITESTSATAASFTTQASRTDGFADRWRKFLSSASLTATTSGSDATRPASTLARWWSGRDRVSANATTAF